MRAGFRVWIGFVTTRIVLRTILLILRNNDPNIDPTIKKTASMDSSFCLQIYKVRDTCFHLRNGVLRWDAETLGEMNIKNIKANYEKQGFAVGTTQLKPNTRLKRHKHEADTIAFAVRGNYMIIFDDETVPIDRIPIDKQDLLLDHGF